MTKEQTHKIKGIRERYSISKEEVSDEDMIDFALANLDFFVDESQKGHSVISVDNEGMQGQLLIPIFEKVEKKGFPMSYIDDGKWVHLKDEEVNLVNSALFYGILHSNNEAETSKFAILKLKIEKESLKR